MDKDSVLNLVIQHNFLTSLSGLLIESQIALIAHFESGKVEQFYQINEF